jgi:hypothetical protein
MSNFSSFFLGVGVPDEDGIIEANYAHAQDAYSRFH